jgi:hypothetical protein
MGRVCAWVFFDFIRHFAQLPIDKEVNGILFEGAV